MNIDIWDVIKASSTKPFGFTEFAPGPGYGGHCIPLDPFYLYWLAKKNNFKVSNTGYLVYYNGLKNEPMFNQEMKFEHYLIKLDCNDEWVEEAILNAKSLLERDELPHSSDTCDKCNYLKKRWLLSMDQTNDLVGAKHG